MSPIPASSQHILLCMSFLPPILFSLIAVYIRPTYIENFISGNMLICSKSPPTARIPEKYSSLHTTGAPFSPFMLSPSGPLYLESQARGTEGEGSPRLRQKRRKIEDLMLTKDIKQNNFIGMIHFGPLCIVPHETQIELCKILHF